MTSEIDRTPSRKTLRKYFPNSSLTDDELYFFARWFALQTKTSFLKPKNNKYFPAFLHLAELQKDRLSKLKQIVDKHDEDQCWEEHDCLNEIIRVIDETISETSR